MTYLDSLTRVREVLPSNESLENHREKIWQAIEYILHNELWKGKLKPYLLNGELIISPERTVAALVEAVHTAIVDGPTVKGNSEKLHALPIAFPLDTISVSLTEDQETRILLEFRNPLKKHQVHKFVIVFDENGTVNEAKSWENACFESAC